MIYGLLGEHLSHSYSPLIHSMLGDYEYRFFEKSPDEVEDFIKNGDYQAINVTIPYKKAVIPYLSQLSERAKKIFSPYRPDWTDEQFAEAEILVSGIEYATFMSVGDGVSLERRISGAIEQVLDIYGIPGEKRQKKVERVLGIDYRGVARHMLDEFKCYVNDANEQDLIDLLKI